MRIPFVPIPMEKAVRISKPFIGIAERLVRTFPALSIKLSQADIHIKDREYLSAAIFCAIFWFSIVFTLFVLFAALKILPSFLIGILASVSISLLSFFYIILYPALIVTRRTRAIERNLLFALRHILIQVRSGISMFDAMLSVSKGGYGLVSEEFEKCTKNISTGTPEIDAINEMAMKNPSLHFRRILWQLANAMKAGADVASALNALVDNLSNEQRVEIRRYGSQLNPLALMYMMTTVVIPSLGITFMFIISSFSGVMVSENMFYLILFALVVFQFMFLGLIKSRRPSFEI